MLAAVSNSNILHMLGQFVDIVQKAGVSNFLVVAIDQRTADFPKEGALRLQAAHAHRLDRQPRHVRLKFQILYEMLSVESRCCSQTSTSSSPRFAPPALAPARSRARPALRGARRRPSPRRTRAGPVRGALPRHRRRGDVRRLDDDAAYGHTYELPLPPGSVLSGAAAPARLRLVARNSGFSLPRGDPRVPAAR